MTKKPPKPPKRPRGRPPKSTQGARVNCPLRLHPNVAKWLARKDNAGELVDEAMAEKYGIDIS